MEEKRHVVEAYLKGKDWTISEFSEVCGIKQQTIRNWLDKIDWDIGKIGDLSSAGCGGRRGRKPGAGTLDGNVKDLIERIKASNPSWGPLKIKQHLFRHEQILKPTITIYRHMKERGLVKPRERRDAEGKGEPRRFEYGEPMAAAQMDLKFVRLSGGSTIYLVSIMDDHSRFILAARFIAAKTMDEVLGAFRDCVREHGVPQRLLSDSGSEFVSWQNFTRFEEFLADLGVEHIATLGNPQGQGKLERWNETVEQALNEHGPLSYGSEAQLWIRDFVSHYNYERPHQGIGGLLPADRFFGMREEVESALSECASGRKGREQIYVSCRAGEHRLVLTGRRIDKLSVLLDGREIRGENTRNEGLQIENKKPDAILSEAETSVAGKACGEDVFPYDGNPCGADGRQAHAEVDGGDASSHSGRQSATRN